MKITYIQDMEPVQDAAWVQDLRYWKYSSYDFETNYWNQEKLFEWRNVDGERCAVCNFVGIVQSGDTMILALPKSVKYDPCEDEQKKQEVLRKYAVLFDLYHRKVQREAQNVDFSPKNRWYPEQEKSVRDWCDTAKMISGTNVIVAVKFEKVYEWMLSWLFDNQIQIASDNSVKLKSKILGEQEVDINDESNRVYTWKPVGKGGKGQKRHNRDVAFLDQEKRNIPDIVCEVLKDDVEEPEMAEKIKNGYVPVWKDTCFVIDAKYSGWQMNEESENGRYKLPPNQDIYKQFFYQEQLRQVYDQAEREDVVVYNLLVLPDYLGDTGTKLMRICGMIYFKRHSSQMIGLLQVNIQKMIDDLIESNETYLADSSDKKDEIKLAENADTVKNRARTLRLIITRNDQIYGLSGEVEDTNEDM